MSRMIATPAEVKDISEIVKRYRGCPLKEAAADRKLLEALIEKIGAEAGRKALAVMQELRS